MMRNLVTVFLLFTSLYGQSLAFSADECRTCVASDKVFCRTVDTNFSSTNLLTDNQSACLLLSDCNEDDAGTGADTVALKDKYACVDDAYSDEYIDELEDEAESFFALAGALVIVLLVTALVGTVAGIAGCVYCCCRSNDELPESGDVSQPLLEESPETTPDQSVNATPM